MKVRNALGLEFSFSPAGLLQSIDVDPIRISMTSASSFARAGANLFLRAKGSATALLGSAFRASDSGFEAHGTWDGLAYSAQLQLSASELSWQWRILVQNTLAQSVELDVLYVQDVGLKAKTSNLVNEYYVSQYLERRVFEDARYGSVVCCRQNMKDATGYPWLMLACLDRAVAASTDGQQFYGKTFRATGEPEALKVDKLPGELAGEASVVALQSAPVVLQPGGSHSLTFVASYLPDHPQASSEADLQRVPRALADVVIKGSESAASREIDRTAPFLPVRDLTDAEQNTYFGSERRHAEYADGELLSFFADATHVVLRAKETRVDRPHGHIMQARVGLKPDERTMSSTAFACGIFHSHLTQGNTNFSTLLSVCTNPATPTLAGQRIRVQLDDQQYVLGVPSAFAMGLSSCRWIYEHERITLEVNSWTSPDAPLVHLDVKVLRGAPVRLFVAHVFDALNGWTIESASESEFVARPRADSMLAGKFPAAQYRLRASYAGKQLRALTINSSEGPESSTFVLSVLAAERFSLTIVGEVTEPFVGAEPARSADLARATEAWKALSRELVLRGPSAIAPIQTILPWFGLNALVHYLTPYGLEQFSGAAWGTRDVSQGPIDMLLCQDKFDEAKQVLRILFSHQNADGGWPQWWMFDSFRAIRAHEAHGDIIYWTILALCSYVRSSGDFAFLRESLPYFDGEPAPVAEHIDRVIALVERSFVPGTALVQFGGGDWNDSLQPVSEELARNLISSWTVEMSYQALREYGEVCERAGNAKASELRALSERIHADFHRHLVKDGVVAGYGRVEGSQIGVLLHPSDHTTGVHYSLLPMNRGVISGMFSTEQAERHHAVIEQHLQGPDGARLMDRPLRYRGGLQTIFQRAESSPYFGREIGLMYVHEHLRYAESLSRTGRAEGFLHALRQAIPVEYKQVVPQGDLRQANCYYSSSDVLFRSRYEADERYPEVIAGKHTLTGGWRVYSSGPGIYIALVVTRLLGLRVAFGDVILDPVLAPSLDGLEASLQFRGRQLTFRYRVEGPGFGPRALTVNGKPLSFEREVNPYREGGAVLSIERFLGALDDAQQNFVDLTV